MEENKAIFTFTDRTILECDCEYDQVLELMLKETALDFVIKSKLQIETEFGFSQLGLSFYKDKSVIIYEYFNSLKDVLYCQDINFLSEYLQSKGWNRPSVHFTALEKMPEFWLFHYRNYIIDSIQLEKKYGKRE
jgi:hypothetical protein